MMLIYRLYSTRWRHAALNTQQAVFSGGQAAGGFLNQGLDAPLSQDASDGQQRL